MFVGFIFRLICVFLSVLNYSLSYSMVLLLGSYSHPLSAFTIKYEWSSAVKLTGMKGYVIFLIKVYSWMGPGRLRG